MNTGFVGKGIGTDHRLVGLHRVTCNLRNQFGSRDNLCRINPCFHRENIATGAHCHHNFFERGISCPLTETVNGALNLPRTSQNSRQRV